MIHEIGVELGAQLKTRGVPFAVVDGPEQTVTTTGARERIVIEHDEKAGDRFTAPFSQRPNPSHRKTRGIGAKITIYAQSAKAGAMPFEHRRRAEEVLDHVIVCMDHVAGVRKNAWTATGGAFVQPADLAKSEKISGAVYELRFTFDRAVMDRTWAGDAKPEAAIQNVAGTDKITLANGPADQTPETGC